MAEIVSKGRLLRGVLMDGQARALLCDTTQMAQAAREAHGASNVATAALGRSISAAALLSASTEDEANDLTMTIKGDGPAGALVVIAREKKIKAYIADPTVELALKPNGKLDVGGAIGKNGTLTVVRDLGLKEPYIGQTALVTGEIAEDVTYYCALSEQVPTLCALGVLVSDTVLSSGGLLVQALPGCEDSVLSALELRAPIYADISAHLLETPMEALFEDFFRGLSPKMLSIDAITYACDCSRERMERVLISLGRDELSDILKTQGEAEIVCHFCRKKHMFTGEALRSLLEQF